MTRSLLLVPVITVGLLGVGAGTAFALSDLTAHYTGLIVKSSSGVALGEIDTTSNANNLNQRLVNDSKGDRQEMKAPLRDRLTTNGQGVYSRVDWYSDAYYCYLSGIGIGLGDHEGSLSYQIQCQNAWHATDQSNSGDYFTGSWVFTSHWQFRSGSMSSSRGELRVCEDEPLFLADICSGARIMGIDYD